METRMPDGQLLAEEFDTAEQMMKRFGELSAKGGKVERMRFPQGEARHEPFADSSKYGAHSGKKEAERRLSQLLKAAQRAD